MAEGCSATRAVETVTGIGKTMILGNPAIRVVCPNFRHPALASSLTKYKFLQQMKNSFETIVNGLSVLTWFQLSNGDLLFS